MAKIGRIGHQHVLVLWRFRQIWFIIVHGSNETGENWHQNKHCNCLRILLKCYENNGKSRLGGM